MGGQGNRQEVRSSGHFFIIIVFVLLAALPVQVLAAPGVPPNTMVDATAGGGGAPPPKEVGTRTDPVILYTIVPMASGEPVGFDYIFIDNSEPSRSIYIFEDISSSGTPLPLDDTALRSATAPPVTTVVPTLT